MRMLDLHIAYAALSRGKYTHAEKEEIKRRMRLEMEKLQGALPKKPRIVKGELEASPECLRREFAGNFGVDGRSYTSVKGRVYRCDNRASHVRVLGEHPGFKR